MPIQKAKEHYKTGRFNCAQAIVAAFKERFNIDDKTISDFSGHGSGKAPDNVCGAYYAAKHILEKHHPEKIREFEEFFLQQAGSLKCKEIRSSRKLSCLGCIEKSAEFVSNLPRKA